MSPSHRRKPRTQGTPAERLVRAFAAGDDDGVRDAAADIIDRGVRGAFDVALRHVRKEFEPDAELDFRAVMLEEAERIDEPDEMVTLLVAGVLVGAAGCPDGTVLARSLPASGAFDATERVRFDPAWFVAQDVSRANPCDIRDALRAMLAGGPPDPLVPASRARLLAGGVFALVGLVRQSIADHATDRGCTDEDAEAAERRDAAAMDARSDAFDLWAERAEESEPGVLVIAEPTSPSRFDPDAIEAMAHGERGGGRADAIEELVDFVEAARAETADEWVVCRLAPLDGALDLEVRASSGIMLDRRSFAIGETDARQALRALERTTIEDTC